MWQTEEYKNFRIDRVKLGDTVTVKFEKLGVEAKAKVVETVWDVVQNRYKSIQIGDARSTLAATINEKTEAAATQVQNASSFLESYIANITALVANSLGLKTIETEADGSQKIYLHNKPNRADSQYQWTINSNGFFLSQDYGQTWTAGIDSDGNAVFNSLAANVINALTIIGGTITGTIVNGSTINGTDLYTSNISSQNGNNVMRVWAGVIELLQGSYYRAALYQTANMGYLRLMSGTPTDVTDETQGKVFTATPAGIAINNHGNSYFAIENSDDGIYIIINGTGYRVGWVNDGNGHWVIGR